MAARDGNKSSTALVVSLILFVLATIILGVTTYLGFDGQKELLQAARNADEEKNKWNKDANWYEFQASTIKSYCGFPLTKKEQENIGQLRKDFSAGTLVTNTRDPNKEETVKLIREKLDGPRGWNEAEKKAQKTYQDDIEQLKKDLAAATKNWQTATDDLKKAKEDLATRTKELDTERTNFTAKFDDLKKKFSDDLATYLADNGKLNKLNEELSKGMETLKAKSDQEITDLNKKIATQDKQKKQLDTRFEKVAAQVAPVNVLDFDKPKGRIESVDRTGRLPFVNLGWADRVKPQLTFGIFGVGPDGRPVAHDVLGPNGRVVLGRDGKPDREGKGTLEIVTVVGEHLSQARVTSLRDETRDPVMRGDLLYNPAWSPTMQQHVAVTGMIDLTGEGRDDLNEFLRNLDRQGVAVDAYLDLKDLNVKGKGINRNTDYLILGAIPEFQGSEVAKEDDPRSKRRAAVVKEMTDMQQKAIENGVTIISLRKFLVMTGYRVPKSFGNPSFSTLNRTIGPSGGAERKEKEKEPAKEEKAPEAKEEKAKPEIDKEKEKDKDK